MYGTCGRIDNKADFDFDYCYVGPYKVYWDHLTAFTNHKEIKPQMDQQRWSEYGSLLGPFRGGLRVFSHL